MSLVFDQPFYYESIKKTIIGFGALFQNLRVIRRKSDGTVGEIIKVPIAYGPKEKFISRLEADPELTNGVLLTVPRMSFEITGYSYDSASMTNRVNRIQARTPTGTTFTYSPTPYDVQITLQVMTKGIEDGLAILEQIVPLFQPSYTMTVMAVSALDLNIDVPITLNSVAVQDDYEGDYSQRRLVIHQFDFTLKAKIIGPITSGGVILRTETLLPNQKLQHAQEGILPDETVTLDQWTNVSVDI